MIGYYNYTVWLTYLSLISAGTGIMVSLYSHAHPFMGVFFLLVSGLCDAFDGKVARSKKNRTEMEKKFGIQIDSLADMVSFGVLPACIGSAMMRVVLQNYEAGDPTSADKLLSHPYFFICYAVMILYILAALIRLAYFNVAEEERQKTEGGRSQILRRPSGHFRSADLPDGSAVPVRAAERHHLDLFPDHGRYGIPVHLQNPGAKAGYQGHSGDGGNRCH